MMEKTCSSNRTFVNECHVASQKIRYCRISLAELHRKKPHQLIKTYFIICTSPLPSCRKPFSTFTSASSAFPAAPSQPARRHHICACRSPLPPRIPQFGIVSSTMAQSAATTGGQRGGAVTVLSRSPRALRHGLIITRRSCRTFIIRAKVPVLR
jgi:hypothetical protein